jgi:hypothetical protein
MGSDPVELWSQHIVTIRGVNRKKAQMDIQYVISAVLIVGGTFTAWAGPEMGVREDGSRLPPNEKIWVRRFGISLAICGLFVLVATLLGFRGKLLDDMGAP